MGFADKYIHKQKGFHPSVSVLPDPKTGIIVIIPCYNEPDVTETLDSLKRCTPPETHVEVLIVINSTYEDSPSIIHQNNACFHSILQWKEYNTKAFFDVFTIHYEKMPKKHGGVGLARKTGMDEAIWRFNTIEAANGLILSLDADTQVSKNYFTEVENHWKAYPSAGLFILNFNHSLDSKLHSPPVINAAAKYELHQRYYKIATQQTNYPYAYHTIGSCFAIKARSYVAQGGMNKRQAGEDFYFIQKTAPVVPTIEIKSLCVYPSPRISKRVPFGTGPQVEKIIQNEFELNTYNYSAFKDLKIFLSLHQQLYTNDLKTSKEIPLTVRQFIDNQNMWEKFNEIRGNTASRQTFSNRFFKTFNAFQILKFLNFAHQEKYVKQPVESEVKRLLIDINLPLPQQKDALSLLEMLRTYEAGNQLIPE
jgi:glycosyltransferase involved in cell wall biosynthesis